MQANDVVFEGPVIAVNRGGAIVLVEVSCLGRGYWVFWVYVHAYLCYGAMMRLRVCYEGLLLFAAAIKKLFTVFKA